MEAIEELVDALIDLVQAKKKHDEERAKVEYDWAYYGSYEINRLEATQRRFETAFKAAVKEALA